MSPSRPAARRTAILGIDPGRDGALCLLSPDRGVERVERTPLRPAGAGAAAGSREADLARMVELVRELAPRVVLAVLERVAGYAGGSPFGPVQLAERRGAWVGILACHGLEVVSPAPRTWQARSIDTLGSGRGAPPTKDRSRMLAAELWPAQFPQPWKRLHDGETDAAHLAAFGLEELRARAQGGSLVPKPKAGARRKKRQPRSAEELLRALGAIDRLGRGQSRQNEQSQEPGK